MKNYNSFNLNNMNTANNTNSMPYTQFVPPCMFMQSQYTMQPMPQAFQDVIEEDFWQWPGSAPGYPIDTMNWQAMPYNFQMPSCDMMPIQTSTTGMPGTTMPNINMPITPVPIASADLQMALELIKEALAGETEDRLFYEYLISTAPSNEDKNIIQGIRDNEIKHFGMFRQLYKDLTGQMPPSVTQEEFTKPSSYCEGLKMAIMGEQSAVEKYRKILFVLTDRNQINKMVEIITDELRHGILYNYLYSKNKCTK